jgi:hypothetical protein
MSEGVSKHPSAVKNIEEEVARKRSLAAALSDVKNRQANRDDVVVDMKEAELARLELLSDEIRPLFDELPDDNDQFEFGLSSGKPPRLWIDMTAHVSMGHDRRTYRFLKDTKAGRVVLAESNILELVADAITNYIAERVLERERILQGDWTSLKLVEETSVQKEKNRKKAAQLNFMWFVLGFGLSAGALYLWVAHNDWLVSLISQLN